MYFDILIVSVYFKTISQVYSVYKGRLLFLPGFRM